MLQAKDLQIGDWYAFHGHPYQCTASDIASLAECEEKGTPTDISEIPITPEILEKNGFHSTNEHTLKVANTYVLHLERRGADYTITIKLNDYFALDYDDRMYRLAEISTGRWDVHHLQQALRLLGIKHEIKL